MSTNDPKTNNGAGAVEQPVHTLRVIVDEAPGDEALSFAVHGFRVNFSPEDLEVELMAQLGLRAGEQRPRAHCGARKYVENSCILGGVRASPGNAKSYTK